MWNEACISLCIPSEPLETNMQVGRSEAFEQSLCDELDAGWDSDVRDRIGAHRVALLQAYFARFGLWNEPASRDASRRVVNEVLRTIVDWNDTGIDRRLVAVARKWIRDFSESYGSGSAPRPSVDAPVPNWLSRAPVLLAKFPSAFLATPLPGSSS
jgi:hypothetical protein